MPAATLHDGGSDSANCAEPPLVWDAANGSSPPIQDRDGKHGRPAHPSPRRLQPHLDLVGAHPDGRAGAHGLGDQLVGRGVDAA
ncbi:MAG: hypothetical protein HWE26_03575, partial [Alteromonadaceae bacterium]|nr:hypothetical protein [Alteromonadaceae bacterium]